MLPVSEAALQRAKSWWTPSEPTVYEPTMNVSQQCVTFAKISRTVLGECCQQVQREVPCLHLSTVEMYLECFVQQWTASEEKTWTYWRLKSRKGSLTSSRTGAHDIHKESEKAGTVQHEEDWAQRHLVDVNQYWEREGAQKAKPGSFKGRTKRQWAHTEIMGSTYEYWETSTLKVTEPWNKFPIELQSSLQILKSHLQVALLEQRDWTR